MPYPRRRPTIAATGRVTLWLTPPQRDLFLNAPGLPKDLGHALHRAPVHKGKLTVRVTREALDALIAVAARFEARHPTEDRALGALLRYLESQEERFEDPPEAAGG